MPSKQCRKKKNVLAMGVLTSHPPYCCNHRHGYGCNSFVVFYVEFGALWRNADMSGHRCCIHGCSSRSHGKNEEKLNNGLRFFCFPRWKKHEDKLVWEMTVWPG